MERPSTNGRVEAVARRGGEGDVGNSSDASIRSAPNPVTTTIRSTALASTDAIVALSTVDSRNGRRSFGSPMRSEAPAARTIPVTPLIAQIPMMSSGSTGTLVRSLPVAARIAATTAGVELIVGDSPIPFAPNGPK